VDRALEIRALADEMPAGVPLVVIDELPFAPELYAKRSVTEGGHAAAELRAPGSPGP
jgi:hypothetical protein